MWSLPNIVVLNERAASEAERAKRQRQLDHPEQFECDNCQEPARIAMEWYDIFSDEPKGIILQCEEHDDSIPESYFYCDGCNRLMTENYTWELYFVFNKLGEQLCLPCALKEYMDQSENWIAVSEVKSVVLDQSLPLFDADTGVLNVSKFPHYIGVEMPVPDTIERFDGITMDSYTGSGLDRPESLMTVLDQLKEKGYTEFLPMLDAAYQFAVELSFYVRKEQAQTQTQAA